MAKASSSDPLAEIVSAAVVARAVGLSARRITQLRDERKLPGTSGGKFVLGAATAAYCDLQRGGAGERGAAADEIDLDRERALLARAQRDGHLMKNARTSSELIDLASAEAAYGAVVDATRLGYLALPMKAAPALLGLTDTAQIAAVLTAMVHEILNDLSEAAFVAVDGELRRVSPKRMNGHG